MNQSACPGEEQLRAYVLGKLPEDMAENTERHLQICQACEVTAKILETQGDSLVEQIREPPSDDSYLAEPQCQVAVARAKLLAGKVVSEERQPTDLTPGQPADLGCLGEYQLLAKLGEGGMGAVYKARQTRLKKIVALKVLPKERTTDPRAVTRFEREMEAIGQLAHPNIVQAHDARNIEGTNVLVMEYVDGKDLARVVQRLGRLRISDACELVRQTALGLQYAHEHGLVHRDIKPSNLMLTILPSPTTTMSTWCPTWYPGRGAGGEGGCEAGGEGKSLPSPSGRGAGGEGIVKILDLGLALLGTEQPGGSELSCSGEALGTADYMAPEQASDAHSVDTRADIYSLGCTLYKLLTGNAPFCGPQYKTSAEKLVGHLKETPPLLRLLRTDASAELAVVIERMMAKSPADRFATAAEVAAAMAPFAAGGDLVRVLAEAAAATGGAMPMEQSPAATQPSAASAVVDTDADGLDVNEEARGRMPAPAAKSIEPRTRPRFGKRPRLWIAVGGAALFAVVLLGVLIIKLQTSEGTLIVKMDDPGAIVQVLNEKGEVLIERPGEKGSVTIGVALGKGRLRLVKDGMQVFTRDFSLGSGGKETIEASLEQSQPSSQPWSPAVALLDAKKAKEQQAACAKQLGVPVEISNSIGMKLALIPSGEFQMGSTKEMIEAELRLHGQDLWAGRLPGELPQHPVRITKPYRLGVTEVTQEEYQRVMGSNPSKFQGDPKRPVEQVPWDDAVEFCRRLSELPAEKAAKRRYGLPTEAQWEYACRAGSTVALQSAADPVARGQEERILDEYAWFDRNSGGTTHPVGQKRANAFGLSDMYGNVAEWCADWYQWEYYAKSPTDDPSGPPTGADRVVRGGCWSNYPWGCRLTARCYGAPGLRDPNVGFRVALVSGEEGATPKPPPDPGRLDKDKQDVLDAKKAKEQQAAWAKQLGVPVEISNSIGMKLALIPSGEFQMGSTQELFEAELRAHGDDQWYTERLPGEEPRHRVRITKLFYLGKYEVTQQEYQSVMGSNPSGFAATGAHKDQVAGQDTKRFPVENVTWDDAVEFCRKLSAMPEEKSAGRTYRLPSEAQWEYACRAGSTGRYSFSRNAIPEEYDENGLSDYGWFIGNSGGMPHAIGGKRPNAWGLSDMQGNVWEWCRDSYQKYYYANSPVDDPGGPPAGSSRVYRGGGWDSPARHCRSAIRNDYGPGDHNYGVGFRVAQVPADK